MSSITRNNFSIHSNSKGNLLKTEYQKDGIVYFVKSGRLQVRDFPEKWGILKSFAETPGAEMI